MIIQILFTISSILTPEGYHRTASDSFGEYIRSIKLKEDKTVYLYNGDKKTNQNAQYAVLDISVGIMDLQQCADAVMRLRSEWLYKTKQFDKIVFYDLNERPVKFHEPYNRGTYQKYIETVFARCNSYSLEKQMNPKSIYQMKIGDVLIKGGHPGHVVIVVDMAVNKEGKKVYMLAQSYMPAQDIHILKGENGPWYYLDDKKVIETPEYTFYSTQCKGW